MRDAPVVSLRAFTTMGVTAFVLLTLLVLSLDRLVGLDERMWRAVLVGRGPATDVVVEGAVDLATRVLTVLLVVAVGLHVRTRGIDSAWPWAMSCGLGLAASKTLKHLLTRERPSSLPDVALGYSFPSAHVMNSLAALLAVIALTHAFRRRRLWWGAAGSLVVVVTAGRVLLGRHWALDVVAGILAAVGLVGIVVPIVVRRPLVGPLALALVLAGIFAIDRSLDERGLRLPSPLVGREEALVDVDLGAELRSELAGDWRESAEENPGGSLVWLEGSGSIPMEVSEEIVTANASPDLRAPRLRLALAGRPATPLPARVTASMALNGRVLATFVPFEGWRQYRATIPAGLLHAGRNEIGIEVRTDDGPWRFAIAGARLARTLPAE